MYPAQAGIRYRYDINGRLQFICWSNLIGGCSSASTSLAVWSPLQAIHSGSKTFSTIEVLLHAPKTLKGYCMHLLI